MKKNIQYLLALLLIVGMGIACTPHPESEQVKEVTVAELKGMIDEGKELTVLDVRTPAEWAGGTIAQAEKLDYKAADFKDAVAKLDKNPTYMVICARGGRSSKAADIMAGLGFTTIYNVQGGMNAWMDADYPIQK